MEEVILYYSEKCEQFLDTGKGYIATPQTHRLYCAKHNQHAIANARGVWGMHVYIMPPGKF